MQESKLQSIEQAIEDLKAGKFVILVDDEERENEGDFIIAAQHIDADKVNFMLSRGRGVLCVPMTGDRCRELDLEMQVSNNTSIHETPFTVTVDLLGHGCTTGVSMHDRAASINALADKSMKATDFGRPGHVNPLRARDGGVLVRAGHTEGTVDLLKLAGLEPVGALIEIINPDGTMARLPELLQVAEQYNITITSIEKLIAYIFLTFILMVACFNIIGSLSMLIIDKKDDVVTLRNLGATERQITQIFLFEGRMISALGAVIGIVVGLLLCWLQQTFGLVGLGRSAGSFIVDAYPVSVHPFDVVLVFATVLVVGFLSVWYPVRYFSKRLLK